MVKKEEYEGIGFRIYLFKEGKIVNDISGALITYGYGSKGIGKKMVPTHVLEDF